MALRRNAKIDLLKRVPLFAECSKAELGALALAADEIPLREGAVLIREDRIAREFFVLVDGTVDVVRGGRKIAELAGGSWFGEIGLITGKPRTATVTASTPVRVLVLNKRAFERVVVSTPSIGLKVLSSLGARLARDSKRDV